MKKKHNISNLKCQNGFLIISIDGEPNKFPLKKISPTLEKASEAEGTILKSLLPAME
jgi:hypothetical protein